MSVCSAFVDGDSQVDDLAFQVLEYLVFSETIVFHSGFCKGGYGLYKVRDDVLFVDVGPVICFETGTVEIVCQRRSEPDSYDQV